MEMEKQQYVKPILEKIDLQMFTASRGEQSEEVEGLPPDTDGEETPDEEEE